MDEEILRKLHADLSQGAMENLVEIVGTLRFDVCIFTGDYCGLTYGPFELPWMALTTSPNKGTDLRSARKSRYHPNGSAPRSHG